MKLSQCSYTYNDFTITVSSLKRYIRKLKHGCAPGGDGITPEHVKYASETDFVSHLCSLFTICFRFGVVPCSFVNGILVPLLKKPSLDASVAKNYRPVILSTIFSKLIELCILDKCSNFVYN